MRFLSSGMHLYHSGNIAVPGSVASKPLLYDLTWRSGKKNKPVVVFVHGFKGFKDWGPFPALADFFAERDFVFLKFNLSHNGTSPDKPLDLHDLEAFARNNFSIEMGDLGIITQLVKERKLPIEFSEYNSEKIFLMGHSRGGSLALMKAAEEKSYSAVATVSAVADLGWRYSEEMLRHWKKEGVIHEFNSRTNQQMPLYYQLYEDVVNNPERFDVQKAIAKIQVPLLLLHGDRDTTVPPEHLALLKKANPAAETQLFSGVNHTFDSVHPWNEKSLPGAFEKAALRTVDFFRTNFHD